MFICAYCSKEFKSKAALHYHLKKCHGFKTYIELIQYDIDYLNLEHPICPICGKKVKLLNNPRRFSKTCGDPKCVREHYKCQMRDFFANNPDKLEKRRANRINYLKNKQNFEKTAWGKRANRELSYLEQWFVDNVIIPLHLGELFDIINEYPSNGYFLDFAFINAKIAFELDGRCHFNNGEDRLQHDIIRDDILSKQGWKIYRISFLDVEQNEKQTIEDIKFFIDNYKNIEPKKLDIENYHSYDIIKKQKAEQKAFKKAQRIKEQQEHNEYVKQSLIRLEQESGIDFSKNGWSGKSMKFLYSIGCKYKKNGIVPLLVKYYPEFFEHNVVHIRKGTKL